MRYREKQDKGTFLTAALKSRNFQGIYFSFDNLELYSCSLHSTEIFCRSTERALGPSIDSFVSRTGFLKVSRPVVFNKVLKKTKTKDVQGLV